MHYSDDIDFILKENVKVLVDWINQNKGPFSEEYIKMWYNRYVELRNKQLKRAKAFFLGKLTKK